MPELYMMNVFVYSCIVFYSIRYNGNKLVTNKIAFVFMHAEKEKRKRKSLTWLQYSTR